MALADQGKDSMWSLPHGGLAASHSSCHPLRQPFPHSSPSSHITCLSRPGTGKDSPLQVAPGSCFAHYWVETILRLSSFRCAAVSCQDTPIVLLASRRDGYSVWDWSAHHRVQHPGPTLTGQ